MGGARDLTEVGSRRRDRPLPSGCLGLIRPRHVCPAAVSAAVSAAGVLRLKKYPALLLHPHCRPRSLVQDAGGTDILLGCNQCTSSPPPPARPRRAAPQGALCRCCVPVPDRDSPPYCPRTAGVLEEPGRVPSLLINKSSFSCRAHSPHPAPVRSPHMPHYYATISSVPLHGSN